MRILDKYIIKKFLPPLLYSIFVFVFLYMIIDLFGHLDEILKHKAPIFILQQYYISMIPFIIIQTIPIATLISTIYVINTMNRHDEIIAMKSSGVNIHRILVPFICIGLAISLSTLLISEKMLPGAMKNVISIKEHYIERENQDRNKTKKPINNIALYGRDNKLIFVADFDITTNTAKGITILLQDKKSSVIEKINAQDALWQGGEWLFSNVLIYSLDENGMVKGEPSFYESKAYSMESPKELISKGANYEYMSFKDLSNYINNFSLTSRETIQRMRVDLHQKISFPFTSLVLMLIGAPFAIRVKKRGKAASIVGVGMSIVIGFMYYAFMAMFIALGKGGVLPPFISAHIANIIFALIGIILIRD